MSELQNVIALTKLHISQHYKDTEWVFTDPETLDFYKSFAQKNRSSPSSQPKPLNKPTLVAKTMPKPKPAPMKAPPKKPAIAESPQAQPAKIERELPKPAAEVEFSDFKKILHEYFPKQTILDKIPGDAKAKEIAHRWEKAKVPPEIVILDTGFSPSEKLFLENVARALEARFYPAAVLKPEEWDKSSQLRLVVGTEESLKGIEHPRVVMRSVDHYLEQPQEKAALWLDLKSTLQSS